MVFLVAGLSASELSAPAVCVCAGCVCLRARLLLQLVAMQEFIQQSGFVGRCGLPGKPFKSADAVLQVLLRTVGVFTCSLTEGDV